MRRNMDSHYKGAVQLNI